MSSSLLQKASLFTAVLLMLLGCEDNSEQPPKRVQLTPSTVDKIDFEKPAKPVILEVFGKISQFNDQQKLYLDRDQLLAFKQVEVKTTTPWTNKETHFKGPLLRDVLAAAGSSGKFIFAKAVNEYAVKIPTSDAQKYSVILAIEQDGEALSIRNKGPIWLIYPWSSVDDLNRDKFYSRSIWQLTSMRLHD